ncbi:hypothetical protein NDU88_004299 [Pleurodeles waltl]|uniref:Uncharacterized protein n=1 Tax=Pleurodeles waltl TaxID=8319 RepID=A0AAV7KXB1_PLEWA|nr:hypothetical protein NDU88_004299 [Pleurodeles waltl]
MRPISPSITFGFITVDHPSLSQCLLQQSSKWVHAWGDTACRHITRAKLDQDSRWRLRVVLFQFLTTTEGRRQETFRFALRTRKDFRHSPNGLQTRFLFVEGHKLSADVDLLAAARHDASDQADASCPRLPVAGATRYERGRGKAVARETGWVSRRGINKREDGTGRGKEEQERRAQEKRREEQERRAEEKRQEEQERRAEEKRPEEEEKRAQETEQEKRAQEEEQERRAQEMEQERRAQERRPEEQERRAQEKEQERREQERRAQERRPEEQERRAQERETKQKTAGEETAAEERHNASHDPGGSWLTKTSPGKRNIETKSTLQELNNNTENPKETPPA